jgi:hypothetical protein
MHCLDGSRPKSNQRETMALAIHYVGCTVSPSLNEVTRFHVYCVSITADCRSRQSFFTVSNSSHLDYNFLNWRRNANSEATGE